MLKYDFVQIGPHSYEVFEKGVPVNISELIHKAFAEGKMAKK